MVLKNEIQLNCVKVISFHIIQEKNPSLFVETTQLMSFREPLAAHCDNNTHGEDEHTLMGKMQSLILQQVAVGFKRLTLSIKIVP